MSRRHQRRGVEQASLSFLDTIACGLGAIILLLVLVKTAEPMILEESKQDLEGLVMALEAQLFEIRGESVVLNRELITKTEQRSEITERIARLRMMLETIRSEFEASGTDNEAIAALEQQLEIARQRLNEAQRRFSFSRPFEDTTVGGIPVDSEYIIFIIDTSGSMFNFAWDLLLAKVIETLEVYPEVKGIQEMNDMGEYMFGRYANEWIPDTPARRRAIIDRLRGWNAFSNSSPVEGITKAISTFYAPDKKISLYVFGDEFTGRSISNVVETVDKINREDARGNRLVRIHAVGFPVQFMRPPSLQNTGLRFASLMRVLCEKNGGTFVGLNSFR
ncbi:MAG: VWA domain-containing protein [Pseudomonadota bacterium]